jgi:pimeloyl-ACP methyl ester carboxylesterase
MTPPRYSQLLAHVIPEALLEEIPQTGHMLMLEQPDAVGKSLTNFLGQIPYHAGEVNWHVSGY